MNTQPRRRSLSFLYDILLIVILLVGAYFRLIGPNWSLEQVWMGLTGQAEFPALVSDWDQSQHLHPDERFLTMVSNSISPIKGCSLPEVPLQDCPNSEKQWITPAEYFDTLNSSLNPNNRGYGFYVYGTLPLFIVRYAGEFLGMTGYDEINLVGRQVSALVDIGSVFLLYLIASRLYGLRVGLLAAAFSALAVGQIQQSHFYTVDNFPTLFILLAAYFSLDIALARRMRAEVSDSPAGAWGRAFGGLFTSGLFWNSILFGLATGMAMASKLNAAPVAGLLPLALLIHFWRTKDQLAEAPEPPAESASPEIRDSASESAPKSVDYLWTLVGFLVLGAFFTIVSFRIFQPYAFSGPGFFGFAPNPAWVQVISEQRAQASGDVDYPPALQWARRPATFSLQNIVAWGLGWPLGILAFTGLLYMGWRILRGEARQHFLLWFWTLAYFLWQSMEWNPTMRYQLPIYPLLAMMAAWFIFNGPRWKVQLDPAKLETGTRTHPAASALYAILGLAVLLSTFAWAHAFTRIYTREHSRVQATRWIYNNIPGPINLHVAVDGEMRQQPLPFSRGFSISPVTPLVTQFNAYHEGELRELSFAYALDPLFSGAQVVNVLLSTEFSFAPDTVLASAAAQADFSPRSNPRGIPFRLRFDEPVTLEAGKTYYLRIETSGELTLSGAAPVNETSWDDGLPLRMDGYDGYGGIYEGGLNFEMYWDDNPEKLERFITNLDSADYVFISSNRQWGTTTRVPERYPLTTVYYRALLGCPADKDLLWCYSVARPGDFEGQLGYELVQTFESYPTLDLGAVGFWEFNTQLADEAFTVYDHPKVLLFKKSDSYNPQNVRRILEEVDLSRVVRLTPRKASSYSGPPSGLMPQTCLGMAGLCNALGAPEASLFADKNLPRMANELMLSPERWAVQRAGGTWSDLFSYDALQNRYPLLGLLLWYLFLAILGWAVYPLLRLLLPGLADRGYPLARLSGLVLLAWMVWFPASVGGVYTRTTIAAAFALLLAAGLVAAWFQREELRAEIRTNGRYFLMLEAVFLAFFVIDLLIRVGNPDLWHPAKGGERPMDFAYLNAILKSTTFPPYDPWYAGGYINYYYYGFVLVGTPLKLLGLVPSIAYNFILPSLFAMLALAGFSVAWNFFALWQKSQPAAPEPEETDLELAADGEAAQAEAPVESVAGNRWPKPDGRWISGLAAALGLVLIGNLGTLQLVFQHLQKQAVDYETFASREVWMIQRLGWALQGLYKSMAGQAGGIPMDHWYWNPSRVMPPGDIAITEFPLFTFLYSDLHAHMIALPLTALALAWALSTLFARGLSPLRWLATLAFGGLVLGALRPTNTWDLPTYLVFALVVTGYAVFRYADSPPRFNMPPLLWRGLLALAAMAALAGFALLFYQPYARWFGLGYTEIKIWENEKTPIWSYWTQWGLFLFILVFWMAWETRQWLAQTPLSALSKLQPYKPFIQAGVVVALAGLLAIPLYTRADVAWFSLPLALWALLLLLRPGISDAKRMVFFMVGTALVITLAVDVVALAGDRMNTVFKFYIQGWVLFAISAAAALAWTLSEFHQWHFRWRSVWTVGMFLLAGIAFLFTLTATSSKIQDRMTPNVPLTLDSMEYMAHAQYWDGEQMQLDQDYRAIRWLQDNVIGSPVIVEGHAVEYRWGSRYTVYTGLPSVVGWNWHQRQQRALMPGNLVFDRVDEVNNFYNTANLNEVREFIAKYDVRYVIVGQMERIYYAPGGLLKFESQEGRLWRAVYRDADTVIYEVIR